MGDQKNTSKSGAKPTLKKSDYVHLHNHTHHSVLDGLTKVDELVDEVKKMGMQAVAITDHGTMSGVIDFYKAAKDADVKPIIGIEAYVAARSRHDRDPVKDRARYHLTLLAMNETGYKNLMAMSTKANLEGMYYRPRIDHELLEQHNEGVIILSGCASSEISEELRVNNYEEAKRIATWYKSVFGDRYYIELQDHGHPDSPASWDVQVNLNQQLTKLSKELDIPRVVTSDGHYLKPADRDAHEILLCVGTGSFLSDEKRMSLADFELHLTDPEDIISRWQPTDAEAVINTKRIADRCQVEINLGGILIPHFPTPDGQTEKEYLDKLVYRGMAVRYHDKSVEEADAMGHEEVRQLLSKEQLERLDMEMAVLDNMGFNGYFLIVQDFINWGKSQGIIFGPGRGSAAGSIISYALNITDLDPLKYDLLFERFLNPDRISMPDIDIDIQDTRRGEVIDYCTQKYGESRVANIVTFGRMAARAAVRDVARVLEVPYGESDRLAKLIPPLVQGRHTPLKKSLVEDHDLRQEYQSNPTAKRVFDFAARLDGTIRSHGVHAAGVVIAPDDLVNYVPLEMAQKGVVATQYSMGPVEDLGLLKMDFLGLSNLTIINNALRIVKRVYGDDIELSNINLEDEKTYQLFQRGDTTGVFQLESAGMKRYLRELKPSRFDDIIAMVALYRPGPMQFIDSFIKRKHGQEEITYLHPGIESSLKNTYGILVYQEQFMQVAKEWAGFSGGQADTLRKAVGKKQIDLMQKVKPEFVEGAVKHGGASQQVAEQFWNQLEDFANYAFNKSHAACYALIAYWTAYLKAHYPDAFMAALMTSDRDDIDRLAVEISECQHMGIEVLAPDVNESFVEFAVVPGKSQIRFGMAAVKGVGVNAVEEVLRTRESEGPFRTVGDFAKRVSTSRFNRRAWESLIKTGGFDAFGDRSDLLFNLESIQGYASKLQKEALSGQADLFGLLGEGDSAAMVPSLSLDPAPARHTEKERLTWERELLGLYISAHPLDSYDAYLKEHSVALGEITEAIDGKMVRIGGVVSSIRTILTKSGKKMAFVKLEDKISECEIVVFPNTYEASQELLVQDKILLIKGKVNARDKDGNLRNEISIIADEIYEVTDQDVQNFTPSGQAMQPPSPSKKSLNQAPKTISRPTPQTAGEAISQPPASVPVPVAVQPEPEPLSKLFINIENPDDTSALESLRQACSDHPGETDVILVLGSSKTSAIRLPFRVDPGKGLIGQLTSFLPSEHVVLK